MPPTTRGQRARGENDPADVLNVPPADTPPTQRQAFDHVVNNILEIQNGEPLSLVITQGRARRISDLLSLSTENIDSLTYLNDANEEKRLHVFECAILHCLKQFVVHRLPDRFITNEEWLTITSNDFDQFRISPDFIVNQDPRNIARARPTTQPDLTTNASKARDPVSDFKRGIKRDVSMFQPFKEDKQWDSWNRATIAQARAQDVSEVLNPKYEPQDDAEKQLFDEKQKYMFAVFEKNLLTDQGKSLVREYADNYDAQRIYSELRSYSLESTKASLDSSNLLTYITSIRLGDGRWKGSMHAFILHWQDQVRKYESIEPDNIFGDKMKRTMIENAVFPIAELRAVKVQADQNKTRDGKELTYRDYVQLLLSAAQSFDNQFSHKNVAAARPTRRNVYNHERYYETIVDDQGDEYFDIDSDIDPIQVYSTNTNIKNSNSSYVNRLNSDQWRRLSAEAQRTWDLLPNDAKSIILEPRKPPDPNRSDRFSHPTHPRSSQLHDISAYDFLSANLHDLRMGRDDDVPNTSFGSTMEPDDTALNHQAKIDDDDGESPILAHLTKRNDIPPGDLQRVLANTMSRQNVKKAKDDEITVNGKKYRRINVHKLTYIASSHKGRRTGALIDRGANGGIAGEDVRVINKTGRHADIQGIDNHQIVDIPIVTAGAVIPTQKGEVIAIICIHC